MEQYKKIKSRIVLQVTTSHPEGINVELESDCKEQNSNNRTCSNVPQSTVVKFKARINIKQEDLCRKASDMFVEISLRGFTKDRLKVNNKWPSIFFSAKLNAGIIST